MGFSESLSLTYLIKGNVRVTPRGGAFHGLGWATAHPKKIKKLTNVGLLCEILYNFTTFFCLRHIQIFVKQCSGPPRKIKNH